VPNFLCCPSDGDIKPVTYLKNSRKRSNLDNVKPACELGGDLGSLFL